MLDPPVIDHEDRKGVWSSKRAGNVGLYPGI